MEIDYIRLTKCDDGKVVYYPKDSIIAWGGNKDGATKVVLRYIDGGIPENAGDEGTYLLVMEHPDDIAKHMYYNR